MGMGWHLLLQNFGWIGLAPLLRGVNWLWSLILRFWIIREIALCQMLMMQLLKLKYRSHVVVFLYLQKRHLKQLSFTLAKSGTGVCHSFGSMQHISLEVCGWVDWGKRILIAKLYTVKKWKLLTVLSLIAFCFGFSFSHRKLFWFNSISMSYVARSTSFLVPYFNPWCFYFFFNTKLTLQTRSRWDLIKRLITFQAGWKLRGKVIKRYTIWWIVCLMFASLSATILAMKYCWTCGIGNKFSVSHSVPFPLMFEVIWIKCPFEFWYVLCWLLLY